MKISEPIEDLYRRLLAISKIESAQAGGGSAIQVDDVVGKLAYFYEKLRNTMDYQEEHLLRRYAIERDIKRRIVLETLKPKMSQALIEGLIRSGYVPNNSVPEGVVSQISAIVNKYAYLLDLTYDNLKEEPDRRKIVNWIAGVAACEIDLVLASEDRVDAMIETLYRIVRDRIRYKGDTLTVRERRVQLYITLHKELVKSDDSIISFHLLNLYFPDWLNADRRLVEFVADKITGVYYGIETHLRNPIRHQLAKSMKEEIVAFKVLKELIATKSESLDNILGDPESFELECREIIERNYRQTKKRLRRSSFRAILYIFITKIALAFVLEYPYERYILNDINTVALAINILFPPLLMFLVTLTARVPGPNNTRQIIEKLRTIVYGDPQEEILFEIKLKKQRGPVYFFFEYLFYILLYGLIFGAIIYILDILRFNILSGGIFIFFVTAVSFFASRIRQITKEYQVEKKREGLRSMLVIFFSLPVIRAGHWLSVNLRRVNLFTFILDFIIEAPFKMLVDLIESWFVFLREKREDTYKGS